MKLLTRLSVLSMFGALAVLDSAGQQLPIQQNQAATRFNYGSAGTVPTNFTDNVAGTTATPGQFRGHVNFGGVVRATNVASLNPAISFVANAANLNLPRGTNSGGAINLVMSRARFGNPFASRTISFLFGETITPPEKDEYGVDLSLPNAAKGRPGSVLPTDYWWREPYTTTEHTNGGYHFSPHAEQTYASQIGNIRIVWQRTAPSTLQSGAIGGSGNAFIRGANRNVLTNSYVVSATPFKPARRMYWTEGEFRDTGKPISVPPDRVQEVRVIHNDDVPRHTAEVLQNGQPASTIPTTNTFWYDSSVGQLRAYNVEGKLLLELLGDLRPEAGEGIREQIGYEIVELIQRPLIDDDVTTELGEVITPFPGPTPEDTPVLTPEPLLTAAGASFDFRHSVPGTDRFDFYAVRETQNQNDYLAHWMESSIAGLRWPYRYVRYKFVWPTDVARYTHYARPVVAEREAAKATAVPLPSENGPALVYQDALDQPRGAFTESFAYYSWLTSEYPAHRALLRFASAGYVRFERVFSWLDEALRVSGAPIASTGVNEFSLNATNQSFGASYGNAYMGGGVLHLTDGVAGQNANYVVNGFYSNAIVGSFRVRFKVRIGDTTSPPADGFGFSFGTLPDAAYPAYPTHLADEGTTNGIAVNFDLWDNGELPAADWAPGIVIKTNGANHAGVAIGEPGLYDARPDPALLPAPRDPVTGEFLALTTGTNFVPVEIVMHAGGAMDVSYRGVKVLERVQTSFTPRTGRFGFSARTGGGNVAAQWIDDLSIEVNPGLVAANPIFANTPAAKLDSWIDGKYFHWPDRATRPFVSEQVADVGQRLAPPDGEIGGGLDTNYLAGYIRASEGDSFLPSAYIDPLTAGFDLANNGAIIPVNAIPGDDRLEVWWFRRNQVDITRGFKAVLWPSVISRYTLQWPQTAAEIVLASNDGSGPLSSLEAKGSIYYQNDPLLPGYNPNEEHALMQGGQAYALRDDLNITGGEDYSSDPFVLLQYTAADGRPAIRPFKVRREAPERGIAFDYNKPAGSILQPPMPLPLLGPAFAPKIAGQPRASLTEELVSWNIRTSDVGAASQSNSWQLEIEGGQHGIPIFQTFVLQNPQQPTAPIRYFFSTSGTESSIAGTISTNRPYALMASEQLAGAFVFTGPTNTIAAFNGWLNRVLVVQVATASGASSYEARVNRVAITPAPALELVFTAGQPALNLFQAHRIVAVQPVAGYADAQFDRWRLAWNESINGGTEELRDRYAGATLADRKGNIWVYRGPHLAGGQETFAMRFYYRTLPGFYFPSREHGDQPSVGTPTPYLRARGADGAFLGDAVLGNADNDQQGDRNALAILYHPVWPENAPVLQMAETLLTPKRGLPAVRGQTSLEVLYQQSQVGTNAQGRLALTDRAVSVALHDPTREKTVPYDQAQLPGSVKTEISRGKVYFPNLPPHLVKRFYLDPNRGLGGSLVFVGEFVDAPLGDKYLLLNVAGAKDREALQNLCLAEDALRGFWDDAIDSLATEVEQFVENPGQPGSYIPASPSRVLGLGELAEVRDDDEAVDSYALTAVGPHSGYVSLIAGNGEAFTPEGEPVSVHVLRVSPRLYRGEVNVVESENPLNERLTLQQVTDLAGKSDEYVFDWRITAPVDGQPPGIYQSVPVLLPLGAWSHLRQLSPADSVAQPANIAATRLAADVPVAGPVVPVSQYYFDGVTNREGYVVFTLNSVSLPHRLAIGDELVMSSADGAAVDVTVQNLEGESAVVVAPVPDQPVSLSPESVFRLAERIGSGPQSLLFATFNEPAGRNLSQVWVSFDIGTGLGARVYLNGGLVATVGQSSGNTPGQNPPASLASPRLTHYFRLPASVLAGGTAGPGGVRTNLLAFELFSSAAPGATLDLVARVEAFDNTDLVVSPTTVWLPLDEAQYTDGVRAVVGGTADVRSLSDNYLTMRYRPAGDANGWSQWTEPQLAEGWIKRVLKGINPFNQRVTDLFNNAVNTEVSIVAQAGQRWEGDVALSLDSINNYGLIEIYETVLNRGKMISVGGGINYGPANDALLLAAGYINDLYSIVGNEAAADASNPTIGLGTSDNTYGDIATALFSFKGQLPSLLEEELALLRGRDDFLVPGVETRPVYNRMVWNYTRGIDAGEVVYALNYNVLDQNTDGRVDADDARRLYPQGHGDAHGHYLTALKGYYHLFLDRNFDWVPRSEAVLVLGKPVSVDYQDERKWAATAGAMARTGKQVFDLTWRRDFQSGSGQGWNHLRTARSSNKRTRFWGADHWAARTGQGAYFNWVVGNAIVPEVDPDPAHANTIQQVDRTTVPELKELPAVAESLQTAMDQAEGGLTPLGLPEDAVPFDLNPLSIANGPFTHFEQIYTRAISALNNAVLAFDNAKDVTRLMRSEEDSLTDFRTQVNQQELAYTNKLIELYGTPYPEDIGPGKTYRTGFVGPDTIHYAYIDNVELEFRDVFGNSLLVPGEGKDWVIDTQTFRAGWLETNGISDFSFVQPAFDFPVDGNGQNADYLAGTTNYVTFHLSSHGYFQKPASWVGKRSSPGRVQQAIADVAKARNAAFSAFYWADAAKYDLDWALQSFDQKKASQEFIRGKQEDLLIADTVLDGAKLVFEIVDKTLDETKYTIRNLANSVREAIPNSLIVGVASGGDLSSPVRAALSAQGVFTESVVGWNQVALFSTIRALETVNEKTRAFVEFYDIAPEEWNQELREATSEIRDKVYGMNNQFMTINARLQELDDAQRALRSVLAEGERIQAEREIFRRRTAAVIQGYRSRDAAFRIFRNEKLERYKSLFDLAAQYTYMAAKAYDYDTGLLGTTRGREFINRIVNARALGVFANGQPQFAGSNTGDPGLSSVLAEMQGDWSVVRSRLGFVNPDAYGTTVSMRYENFRITTNNNTWQNILNLARRENLLDDTDVRRHCMQINSQNGAPVPGLVFEFSTTIADGLNLFGRPLAPFDHAFTPSSFATKIFAVGVSLEGYVGMDDPTANSGAVEGAGGNSPGDPNLGYLNPDALAATPYIYLIPVGADSMRSPPLGDMSTVRTWNVQDVTIPLPFNIGGSDFSTRALWQSEDSLTEPLFNIRKHQAFRPISDATLWDENTIYSTGGELWHNRFTNTRLIGRSAWNSKWKIIIPGRTLLGDPNEGIERFTRTVRDIKLYFHTYSYSGN